MTMLGALTPLRIALALIAGLGLLASVIAFVPSPLRLLDLFQRPEQLEIRTPPPLKFNAVQPVAAFDAIAARPLFNPDRKPDPLPPPPEAAKPAITLGDLSQYRVVGTVRADRQQLGLLQKNGGPVLTLKPGDTFEGWTVNKIDHSGIAISGGDRKEILAIPKAVNAAKTP